MMIICLDACGLDFYVLFIIGDILNRPWLFWCVLKFFFVEWVYSWKLKSALSLARDF